jgi:hypothetical protein
MHTSKIDCGVHNLLNSQLNLKSMEKEILTIKLLKKEIIDKNKSAIKIVADYSKVADIIERTHLAIGKRAIFKVSTSTTFNEKLNLNVFASTH